MSVDSPQYPSSGPVVRMGQRRHSASSSPDTCLYLPSGQRSQGAIGTPVPVTLVLCTGVPSAATRSVGSLTPVALRNVPAPHVLLVLMTV